MINLINGSKMLVLSAVLAAGTAGVAFGMNSNSAQSNNQNYSTATVRQAQQQLKNDGYYTGSIDGVDGPMTHSAIRQFQRNDHLKVNGRLDRQTRQKLGVQNQS